jgi:protein-S-isoprenylcysteine O-methyltransferase Ste14
MYLGGITGAFGLALFAGSVLGFIYSFILALVLSHIADSEEEDLRARFGQEYVEYQRKVPKIFPRIW